jgi:apolipoprotein N-acyltransferase
MPSNTWGRRGLALAAGLLIAAAMPPWGWWPLAPVGVALWALLLDDPSRSSRAITGMLVAWGWFLPSNLWMVKFTPVGWPVGVMVWFGALGAVIGALVPRGTARFLALPGLVVLWEWLRWHAPFGGVPLSMLAVTQARGPLLPVARLAGSLGVSAAVAFAGAALGALAARRALTAAVVGGLVVAVAVGGVWAPAGHPVRDIEVAAVQGGGPQETRSEGTNYYEVFTRHLEATEQVRDPVDLIVWPENVINVATFHESIQYQQIAELARQRHATVVVGVVESVPGRPDAFFNTAVVFGPDGAELDRYDKVRRVPFGEYVPLRNLLDPIAHAQLPPKDAVVGTAPNAADSPAGRVGMVISWEVFFPRRVRSAANDGAEIILNPTNGSSYWLTQVQTQQIASSTLRAVESGRWLVQAAPTGFSAVIDPSGNVFDRTDVGTRDVAQRQVQLRRGSTIAMVVGNTPALVAAAAALVAAWLISLSDRRRSVEVVSDAEDEDLSTSEVPA